jgi:hypothetical protein
MLSASMTVTAVVYAYVSDSMPKICLTETDEMMISYIQESSSQLATRQPFRFCTTLWSGRWSGLRSLWYPLSRRKTKKQHPSLSRAQREEAATRFILALSDQQLVVGLAILVATIANQCTLNVTEFRIAFALAWISTTTHLATLDSLRHYFLRHQTVRNWRVFGMLVVMVLFLYCFIVVMMVYHVTDESLPVQCYISGKAKYYSPDVDTEEVSENEETEYIDLIAIAFDAFFSYASWAGVFLFVVSGYKSRIYESYDLPSSRAYSPGPLYASLAFWVLKLRSRDHAELATATVEEVHPERSRLGNMGQKADELSPNFCQTGIFQITWIRSTSGTVHNNVSPLLNSDYTIVSLYAFIQLHPSNRCAVVLDDILNRGHQYGIWSNDTVIVVDTPCIGCR